MTVSGFDDYATPELVSVHCDMPAREYHEDADGPRLSQSLATLCVQRSAAHAWQAAGSGSAREYEPGTDDGTILHSLILEPDSNQICEIDPSELRTKSGEPVKNALATSEGKRLRDDALARGQIPILTEKLGAYRYKAKAIRQRLEMHPKCVLFDGRSEVVIYWTEETPSGPVRCRCRIDHLTHTGGGARMRIIDLKTTDNAHRFNVMRQSWDKGYEIQHAAYTRAVEVAFPAFAGRVDVVFAFVEIDKPYAVNPVTFGAKMVQIGAVRWERGRNLWARCLAEDDWPSYAGDEIDPPGWAETQEMAES